MNLIIWCAEYTDFKTVPYAPKYTVPVFK